MANYDAAAVAANIPKAPTIASAVGRLDSLNERLIGILGMVSSISEQIGGPRPASGKIKGANPQLPSGAVARLNDSAETSHDTLNDIEETLKSIMRALG